MIALDAKQLEAAWRRMRSDHRERRTFYRPPYLLDAIEFDLAAWLAELEADLTAGSYQSSPVRHFAVPKPRGLVRLGASLSPVDEVVYSACVTELVPAIQSTLGRLDPHPDYAYRIPGTGLPAGEWFENWFTWYRRYTEDSIALAAAPHTHVVFADIAGYYEQIDLQQLRSDLLAAGATTGYLNPANALLHDWGPLEKRGLPQGYSASDILGKLYLHPVDEALSGYKHLRWVDDYRVFVRSAEEGRRVLLLLAEQLSRRGLVLQSAKTKVVPLADAIRDFRIVKDLLGPIQEQIAALLAEAGLLENDSVAASLIDSLLTDGRGGESVAVLEEAYEKYFGHERESFNKSLFRYLLRRLSSAGSHYPFRSIESMLWAHPEETQDILKYLAAVGMVDEADGIFERRLGTGGLIYDYQLLEYLEWRLAQVTVPTPGILRALRVLAPVDTCVSTYVGAVLGKWGLDADRDDIIADYSSFPLAHRPDVLCSLASVEKGKRNAFYGRVSGDSADCARAVAAVKSGKL